MPSVKGYGQDEQSALDAAKGLLPESDMTKYRNLNIGDSKRESDGRTSVEISYTMRSAPRQTQPASARRGPGATPLSEEVQLIRRLRKY